MTQSALTPPAAATTTTADAGAAATATPLWHRAFTSITREHGFEPLAIEGRLPDDLVGTYYRNGPGAYEVGAERYGHWFDCDGAVAGVRLLPGQRALGAVKLVQTPWLARQRAAGKRLHGGYDTPLARPMRELFFGDMKNPANTSVMLLHDRLYALCEVGRPWEVSLDDLATIGVSDLDGAVVKGFSAHPHRVPSRRASYNFGLTIGRHTRVDLYALPDDARASRIGGFTIDGPTMMHDFAVTEQHLVFFVAPFRLSILNVLRGQGLVSGGTFKRERGSEIVVVPIDRPRDVVRFTTDAFYMEHIVNAYERDGGELVVDYVHYRDLRAFEDGICALFAGAPRAPKSEARRAVIDPARRRFASEALHAHPIELPRVAPRVEGGAHRYSYAVGYGATHELHDHLLKHDALTGRLERYSAGPDRYVSEGVFVARPDAREEDDGWLLTVTFDARTTSSALEVLDARALADGPVARAAFDHHIPVGFHGLWRPAS